MKYTLLLTLLMVFITGCGGTDAGTPTDGSAATINNQDPNASPYQLLIATSDLTAQDNRLVLTLWDGPNRYTNGKNLNVALFTLQENNQAGEKVWEGDATPYRMGDLQYWVAYPTLQDPGNYGIVATLTTEEDTSFENIAVVAVKADAEAPAIGEAVPAVDTLTLDDVTSVEELSSAGPWIEDFYRINIADATTSGKPSVILFATPGHCTSALCTPVLLTMSQVYDDFKEQDINFVHIEIWRDFERQYMDPAVTEWNLPSEPWVFVLNADGTVGARLDGPVSREELEAAITDVVGRGGQ